MVKNKTKHGFNILSGNKGEFKKGANSDLGNIFDDCHEDLDGAAMQLISMYLERILTTGHHFKER